MVAGIRLIKMHDKHISGKDLGLTLEQLVNEYGEVEQGYILSTSSPYKTLQLSWEGCTCLSTKFLDGAKQIRPGQGQDTQAWAHGSDKRDLLLLRSCRGGFKRRSRRQWPGQNHHRSQSHHSLRELQDDDALDSDAKHLHPAALLSGTAGTTPKNQRGRGRGTGSGSQTGRGASDIVS